MSTEGAIVDFPQVIDGHPGPAASGEWLDSVDPATGMVWARVPASAATDVDAAVAAAQGAFPAWWGLPALARAAHLRRIAEVLSDTTHLLAEIETRDNGRCNICGGDPLRRPAPRSAATAIVTKCEEREGDR